MFFTNWFVLITPHLCNYSINNNIVLIDFLHELRQFITSILKGSTCASYNWTIIATSYYIGRELYIYYVYYILYILTFLLFWIFSFVLLLSKFFYVFVFVKVAIFIEKLRKKWKHCFFYKMFYIFYIIFSPFFIFVFCFYFFFLFFGRSSLYGALNHWTIFVSFQSIVVFIFSF